ncbi:MAG: hypothetical protein HY903_03570 [Deltaproteobacteria bacterium]|nr:hypothetical protein [Deltaproteobacteria bacterium]
MLIGDKDQTTIGPAAKNVGVDPGAGSGNAGEAKATPRPAAENAPELPPSIPDFVGKSQTDRLRHGDNDRQGGRTVLGKDETAKLCQSSRREELDAVLALKTETHRPGAPQAAFALSKVGINSLSADVFERGTLAVTVPLTPGRFSLPVGMSENAILKIPDGASMSLSTELLPTPTGPRFHGAKLQFSEPLCLENAASLAGVLGKGTAKLGDLLTRVEVSGLTIDAAGALHLTGTLTRPSLNPFRYAMGSPAAHDKLESWVTPGMLPKVNLGAESLLAGKLFDDQSLAKAPLSPKGPGGLDLPRLLSELGAIGNEAHFELALVAKAGQAKVCGTSVRLEGKGGRAAATLKVKGDLRRDASGALQTKLQATLQERLQIDLEQSAISAVAGGMTVRCDKDAIHVEEGGAVMKLAAMAGRALHVMPKGEATLDLTAAVLASGALRLRFTDAGPVIDGERLSAELSLNATGVHGEGFELGLGPASKVQLQVGRASYDGRTLVLGDAGARFALSATVASLKQGPLSVTLQPQALPHLDGTTTLVVADGESRLESAATFRVTSRAKALGLAKTATLSGDATVVLSSTGINVTAGHLKATA